MKTSSRSAKPPQAIVRFPSTFLVSGLQSTTLIHPTVFWGLKPSRDHSWLAESLGLSPGCWDPDILRALSEMPHRQTASTVCKTLEMHCSPGGANSDGDGDATTLKDSEECRHTWDSKCVKVATTKYKMPSPIFLYFYFFPWLSLFFCLTQTLLGHQVKKSWGPTRLCCMCSKWRKKGRTHDNRREDGRWKKNKTHKRSLRPLSPQR